MFNTTKRDIEQYTYSICIQSMRENQIESLFLGHDGVNKKINIYFISFQAGRW